MITAVNQARAIFLEAIELPDATERARLIVRACEGDSELLNRVERLIRSHEQLGSYHDGPSPSATTDGLHESLGTHIGPYKLLQQIGEGGMGVVYMAEQEHPVRRRVALKVIKPGMDSRQVIARFEAEKQALSLMDHVNIARVLDAGTTAEGRPYFVMELVHGVPITKYSDDHHLTPRERLELFVPICQAIQHAHQKGIIHRDIKPSNVMITLYDGKPVPKVIDFGVAKATEQKLTERTLFTQYGTMVGTLEYMSPEQAEMSALGVDTRSDIYSLGVLLYELLAGSPPFTKKELERASMLEMLRVIREQEPTRPSTKLSTAEGLPILAAKRGTEPAKLARLVKGELDWIVMKCLEKDRSRRYETASAFAADVQRYLRDEPVEACPPSALYRFSKFARRHRRGLLSATVVAVAVLLTAAASGGLIWRANRNLHHALENERRGAYFERIALAEREWATNNLGRMEQLLDDCPEDLRGWEWRYLKRLRFGALPPLMHESPVYSVAFSPDGQYLATATKDGFIRLWRAKSGHELRKWRAHNDNATSVAFSRDGRFLASGGWDSRANLWEVQAILQGEEPETIAQFEHADRVRVWSVAFSPDSQRLATAGGRSADERGELKVWDLKTRQASLVVDSFSDRPSCVRFSPDGRQLATATPDAVQLWDAHSGRQSTALRSPTRDWQFLDFSPDGRRLAAGGGLLAIHPNREVKVWDTHTGKQLLSLHGHVGGIRGVAFSTDGRRVASVGLDQTIKLWDAATGEGALTLRGHLDNVFCVAFSPDGHQIASGSLDKCVRIWDATPAEREPVPEYLTLRGHDGAVTDVAFHPTDGRTLVSAGTDGTVRLWDFRSGNHLATLPGTPSSIGVRVAFCADGKQLAVCSRFDQVIKMWDFATAKEVGNFSGHKGETPLCVALSHDGKHGASAGFDFTVRIWDATSGKLVRSLSGLDWVVWGVAFSPDGRHIAACSANSMVRVWDWTTGETLPVLDPRHAARVADVAFSHDGKLLASASWDRTIKVWDSETWKLKHDLSDPTGAVLCVKFGGDHRLAWGSTDGTVKVWDGPGTETKILRGHTSWIQGVAFSPDDKWIASASLDGAIKIWHAPPRLQAPPSADDLAK